MIPIDIPASLQADYAVVQQTRLTVMRLADSKDATDDELRIAVLRGELAAADFRIKALGLAHVLTSDRLIIADAFAADLIARRRKTTTEEEPT